MVRAYGLDAEVAKSVCKLVNLMELPVSFVKIPVKKDATILGKNYINQNQ